MPDASFWILGKWDSLKPRFAGSPVRTISGDWRSERNRITAESIGKHITGLVRGFAPDLALGISPHITHNLWKDADSE